MTVKCENGKSTISDIKVYLKSKPLQILHFTNLHTSVVYKQWLVENNFNLTLDCYSLVTFVEWAMCFHVKVIQEPTPAQENAEFTKWYPH